MLKNCLVFIFMFVLSLKKKLQKLLARSISSNLKGTLNPNFLNLTINREKNLL